MPLTSSEVNYLVYRYLRESGFLHSSYIFQYESQIYKSQGEIPNVEPGKLIRVLQKGLQYMEIETHLNEDGTARLCNAPFNLIGRHVCSYSPGNVAHAPKLSPSEVQDAAGKQSASISSNGARVDGSAGPIQPTLSAESIMEIESGGATIVHGGSNGRGVNASDSKYDPGTVMQNGTLLTATPRQAWTAANTCPPIAAFLDEKSIAGDKAAANALPKKRASVDKLLPTPTSDDRRLSKGSDRDMEIEEPAQKPETKPETDRMRISEDSKVVLSGHEASVFVSAWNPVLPNLIATGAGDGTARIWDLSKIKAGEAHPALVLQHLPNHSDVSDVTVVVWNGAGTLLATASYDGQVRIWTQRGELRYVMRLHQGPVIALKWNKKGDYLLSGSLDKTIVVWDTLKGEYKQQLEAHKGPVLDVDWLDNTTFASGSDDMLLMVWMVGENKPIKTFVGHKAWINMVNWHPSGKYIASASDDGTAKVWSMDSDGPRQSFAGHSQQVYAIQWMPRRERAILATGSFDGTVRIWDADNGACLRVISSHTDPIHCLGFSPDGKMLASGAFDRTIHITHLKV
ncbi:hypothetical protein EV182_000815, partial [Spiromyces aspiralis]